MKNRYIETNLKDAVTQLLPENGFEKVLENVNSASRKEVKLMKNNANVKSFNFHFKKIISISVAACLVLVIGIFGFGYYQSNFKVTSIIDIDVNPSIELSANSKDRVLEAAALNEDAKKVLLGLELEGTELNTAVNAIVGSMYKNGYLKPDRADLLVTVQNEDKAKADTLRKSISVSIDNSLKDYKLNGAVANQTVTDISPAEELAKKHNISKGKATLIARLCEADKSLKADELAPLSVKEIIKKVDKATLYALDLIDPDDDPQDIYEDIVESVPPEGVELISAERAKEIALNDAGLKASAVESIKSELDKEGATYIYEIDFKSGKYEYEYDINAQNGSIVKKNKEYDDDREENIPQMSSKPVVSENKISAAKAKEIALNHAGVKAADAKFIKAELDLDDGVYEYDIEFKAGNYEYDYTINAKDGKIIEFDKEIDD